MAAQTGGILAGCCGIIVETLCINYSMFNKCCGSCEAAATCCSSCNCGYEKDRPSRRSRNNVSNDAKHRIHEEQASGNVNSGAPPPSYNDTQNITRAPSPLPPMSTT